MGMSGLVSAYQVGYAFMASLANDAIKPRIQGSDHGRTAAADSAPSASRSDAFRLEPVNT